MTPAQLADQAASLALNLRTYADAVGPVAEAVEPFVFLLAIFLMACFVGYYVVWKVTPALHSPLMAVTNAISSVIIVGAILAGGLDGFNFAKVMGFIAIALAAVNIFGGFIVTQRMLSMFKKKTPPIKAGTAKPISGKA
jgi:NAD(P) transhydrogenase subunit alpha